MTRKKTRILVMLLSVVCLLSVTCLCFAESPSILRYKHTSRITAYLGISGGTADCDRTGNGSDLRTFERTCIPEQSLVPCGDRSLPGIVGDHDPCSHLYETACLSVDSVRRCGGDRVSVSADLSDGTEWLVLWIGHSGGAACHSGGRSGDFLYP